MSVLNQEQELLWGGLVLDSAVEVDTPWRFETLVGTTFGNPVRLVEYLKSQLQDGELAVTTGFGNREGFPVIIRISAPDGQALAMAEAALMAEALADQIAPLIWLPPALEAWSGALEIVNVDVERDYPVDAGTSWDYREKYSHTRVFRLTFTALPWVRDLESTIIPALPVPEDPDDPPVVVSINDCTSTTGWSALMWPSGGWSGVAVSTASGGVQVTGTPTPGSGQATMSLVLTDSETMGATPYLVIEVPSNPTVEDPRITAMYSGSSTIVEPVAVVQIGGFRMLCYFEAPPTWTSVRIRKTIDRPASSGGGGLTFRVYDVSKTDRIAIDGTNGFQVARTAIVGGSVPTQAAIRFNAGTDPLVGSTALIYTGSSPVVPLRARRISSATVHVSGTKISGAYNDLSDPMVFRVPVNEVRNSSYTLLPRLEFTGTAVVQWQARIVSNAGAAIPGSDVVLDGETLLRNDTADPWHIHALAKLQLPVVAIEGTTTHAIELTISMTTGGEDVNVDEVWLADTLNGAVTLVHEPSAFQLSQIEIRSPQLDSPRPAAIGTWIGYGSQDISRLTRLGTHLFKPGLLYVFTATDLAKYAPCELEYYRRHGWHSGPDLPNIVEAA